MALINNLVTLIKYVRLFNLLQNNQKVITTVNLIFLPSYIVNVLITWRIKQKSKTEYIANMNCNHALRGVLSRLCIPWPVA